MKKNVSNSSKKELTKFIVQLIAAIATAIIKITFFIILKIYVNNMLIVLFLVCTKNAAKVHLFF